MPPCETYVEPGTVASSPTLLARGFLMDATPTPARSHPSDIWVVLRGLEGVDDTLLEHPAFEYLLPLLEDREIPESAAWNGKTDVYVATDHRVIHLKTDFLQKTISTVTSYPYSDIRTFRAETGFMSLGCTMAMVIGDAKRLPMKPETRQRFATVVRSHVSAHQVPDVSSGFVPPLQSTASKPRRKKV